MPTINLDHLVIAAANLAQGVAWAADKLGVQVPPGGEHPQMGTHNHVMQLGGGVYLEIIAINPDAPAPDRPRWFSMDDPLVRTAVRRRPRLLTWVINTDDVDATPAGTDFPYGTAERMKRGDLRWRFTIPMDGQLPAAGFLPTLIEWETPRPIADMADPGCRLQGLTLHHPRAAWLKAQLEAIGAADLVTVHALTADEAPYMTAAINTPDGAVVLSSAGEQ